MLHRLSFGDAIERDLLSDYQVVVVGVDDETYRTYAERGEFVTRDGKKITDARTLAGQIALAKTTRKYDLHRVVSFHGRVKAAREFSAEMPDVVGWMPSRARPTGAIWSEHVSGTMTSGRRDRLLLRFRNLAPKERGLLSNARCLGEGVDVPSIDGVAFIDPRRSTIDIVQALGRAIRKAPDKKLGTIVLPVFISEEEDPEQAARRVRLQARLGRAQSPAGTRRGAGRGAGRASSSPRRSSRPAAATGEDQAGCSGQAAWAPSSFVPSMRASSSRPRRRGSSTSGCWSASSSAMGTHLVPKQWREDGYWLGRWVGTQRASHRQQTLDPQRQVRLEVLPGWTWDPLEADWEEGFASLAHFVERERHAQVPARWREDGYPLGKWVSRQRGERRRGRLDATRRARLEALPEWTWGASHLLSTWEESFARLEHFVEREGHARVPSGWRENGYQLFVWVNRQRQRFKRRQLDKVRCERLEALPGWTWSAHKGRWDEGLTHLRRFVEREGHARVPARWREDGFQLGQWVGMQRASHRQGALDPQRQARLEDLPGWTWDRNEARWEEGFASLEHFVEREGHARVRPGVREDGYPVGQWVQNQRQFFRRKDLDQTRIKRLEALRGWSWNSRNAAWEQAFASLEQYVEREGHARVPAQWREDGYWLGRWVGYHREAYRKGELDPKRQARLEGVPGWTWDARKAGARG